MTNMRKDHTSVLDSFTGRLTPHLYSKVIDELGNEHTYV